MPRLLESHCNSQNVWTIPGILDFVDLWGGMIPLFFFGLPIFFIAVLRRFIAVLVFIARRFIGMKRRGGLGAVFVFGAADLDFIGEDFIGDFGTGDHR